MLMVRRQALFGSVIVAVVLSISSGAYGGESTKPKSEALTGPGAEALLVPEKLQVCTSDNPYTPMYMWKNRKEHGFDWDLARVIANAWGLQIKFNHMAFDGLIPAMDAGRCDLIMSAQTINKQRLEVLDAVPYLKTGPAIAVPAGNPLNIHSIKDFSGKTFAVQSATNQLHVLKDIRHQEIKQGVEPLTIQPYPEVVQAASAVLGGKADALVETNTGVAGITKRTDRLVPVPTAFKLNAAYGIFMTKENNAMKNAVTRTITQFYDNGTLEKIANRYGINKNALVRPSSGAER